MTLPLPLPLPSTIDVSDPWWRFLSEPEKEAVRNHLRQFGVDPDRAYRVEIMGDALRVFEYHGYSPKSPNSPKFHKASHCPDDPYGRYVGSMDICTGVRDL